MDIALAAGSLLLFAVWHQLRISYYRKPLLYTAIALVMISGAYGFAPNPLDGFNFFLEPIYPLAAAIVNNSDGLFAVKPFPQTIYAFAAVLLVSAGLLSFAGWAAKQPLRRYGIQ